MYSAGPYESDDGTSHRPAANGGQSPDAVPDAAAAADDAGEIFGANNDDDDDKEDDTSDNEEDDDVYDIDDH
jgi:hypothetical protein